MLPTSVFKSSKSLVLYTSTPSRHGATISRPPQNEAAKLLPANAEEGSRIDELVLCVETKIVMARRGRRKKDCPITLATNLQVGRYPIFSSEEICMSRNLNLSLPWARTTLFVSSRSLVQLRAPKPSCARMFPDRVEHPITEVRRFPMARTSSQRKESIAFVARFRRSPKWSRK